ncbi:hypothetical protein COR50_04755 [Chitinophaga caeni]|uniref:Thiamine phosphate synthase/TenI domain-containing protein n=1 Tax=Chitinophaga caeni TaxID=2029983 RepID=A0A291QRK1_9BACT|nr:thiamine phosphate synthase [Chitinophaga caeni]ATL46541.1 hypothetical protein COR50_04755 [Chitinophaga caeni]
MIWIFSAPEFMDTEHLQIQALLNAGLQKFVVRKPGKSRDEYLAFLSLFSPGDRKKMILADFPEIATGMGLGGIHFSTQLRTHYTLQQILSWRQGGMTCTTSTHGMKEFESLEEDFDYLFAGPLFESISKPGYQPKTRHQFEYSSNKLIALGGIQASVVEVARELGIKNIALLGAVWSNPGKAVENYLEIAKLWRQGNML